MSSHPAPLPGLGDSWIPLPASPSTTISLKTKAVGILPGSALYPDVWCELDTPPDHNEV